MGIIRVSGILCLKGIFLERASLGVEMLINQTSSDAAASFLQSGHVRGWPFGCKRSRSRSKMDRMISIRSRTRLAVSRQNFIRLRTASNLYAWHARINRNGS